MVREGIFQEVNFHGYLKDRGVSAMGRAKRRQSFLEDHHIQRAAMFVPELFPGKDGYTW